MFPPKAERALEAAEKVEPMSRADMVTLESALRNGWPVHDQALSDQLRRVQAVLDDPRSNDRARWRARRVLQLAQNRLNGEKTEMIPCALMDALTMADLPLAIRA